VAVWAVCLKVLAEVSSFTKQVNPCGAVNPGVIVNVQAPVVLDLTAPAKELPKVAVTPHPETDNDPPEVPLWLTTPARTVIGSGMLQDAELFRPTYCVMQDVPVPELDTMLA
jgi:hypothetical protein